MLNSKRSKHTEIIKVKKTQAVLIGKETLKYFFSNILFAY